MGRELKPVVCRVCHAQCGLLVEMEDGKPGPIHGDKNNPAYHGYSCIKGREGGAMLSLPSRLLTSLKRDGEGAAVSIASGTAIAEIAERVRAIVAVHGPRSVALYVGTFGALSFTLQGFALAFMQALGSRMVFPSIMIDQPGKGIALALNGPWLAGVPAPEDWDALLLVGTNPVVSMNGGLGMNPARNLKLAKARGMKLVVLDPRETECAKQADVFLQCRPGEDSAILAALARQWMVDGQFDRAFVDNETQGFEALKAAVMPFTPEVAAARADVSAEKIVEAARLLGAAPRGAAVAGTGPNMSGRSNLVEYMVRVLTSLRGWWLKAGEERRNPGVLIEPLPPIAASPGPFPGYGFGEKLRMRGLTETLFGMPTGALADEILMPGDGQVKALFVLGGNPMLAWPDQIKTHAAMKALDLLVCVDPRLSATARLAHYVIAPKLPFEVEGNTSLIEYFGNFTPGWGFDRPYAQAAPALTDPPPGADVIEDWELFYGLAQQLGLSLKVKPFAVLDPARAVELATEIDMTEKPSATEAWRIALKGAPVPYDEVAKFPRGRLFDRPRTIIQEKPAGWTGRLELGAGPMMDELNEIATSLLPADDGAFPLRLISRRLHDVYNSSWHENPRQRGRRPYNPAFMNPGDMARFGISAGDVVEITSARASIVCVAEAAPDVRPGSLSVSHGWGDNPGEPEDPFALGGNTGKLSFNDRDFDRFTGIPLMSAIPVSVRKTRAVAAE